MRSLRLTVRFYPVLSRSFLTQTDVVMRKPSPDWAFRNPHASQYASRTSLEMDLDLDISPRARERRHRERDRARSRNKARASESRAESSRGHGVDREHEKSKHRTRPRAHSRASGVGRERPDRNERPDTGTPSIANHSTAGSVSLDHGLSGSNPGEEVSELLAEATLSEVALGKRPDRGFAGNPIRHETDRNEAPCILPVPAHSTIPQPSTLESARATKARMVVGRIEEGFATMKMRRRRGRKDKEQMKWAKPVLEAIAAEWWLDNEPNLRAKVLSLRRELDKEERRLARMGPEHYASQRHRQRRTGTASESRDRERGKMERDARETRMHHEPVDTHLVVEEGGEVQGENKTRRSSRVGKRKTRVGFGTRTMHPSARNPTLRKKRRRRVPRVFAENTDPEWVDEDPISEAGYITPFPPSTNSVTPFTSMWPSSPASASRLKDSKGQEKRENALTPFTAMQPSSPSPSKSRRRDGKGHESTENILTPFTMMQPSSGPPPKLKDGEGKGKIESNVTPFTAMEPPTSRSKLKNVKYRTTVGGLRPFMLLQPHPGAVPSKKRDERASHPPSTPFPRRPSRHSLPEILTQFPNPPIPEGDFITQSPLALQSQLSALIEEINAQHDQGQIPSPERLEEMVRLGRAIEEGVKEIEERGAGDGTLPPPYHAVADDDDDERIGIAL
ncbi:hypothetical protein FA13DRAFT_140489 [Coprinellus micaceus]|uniref:Uncharacterized protein n=1 Tax=Coprinellus micaceus TaxID=71717 RepID=A0A4Y7SHF5_COPMI|nr:hypothetical protein FA13DRAFT_140489 [Coprinellus micaceus]